MSDQPGRQQPFRFWFPSWTNPTPAPPRPPAPTRGRSQPRPPAPSSQPVPSTTRRTPRAPSPSTSPSVTPSPSRTSSRSQPFDQRPLEQPSPPPSRAAAQLRSPSRSAAQPPPASTSDSRPTPRKLEDQSPAQLPSPDASQTKPGTPKAPKPETQLETTSQPLESIPGQPTSENLKPKQIPSENQPKEIKEKSKADIELKQETKPYLIPEFEQEHEDNPEGKIERNDEINQKIPSNQPSKQEKESKEIEAESKRKAKEIQEMHPRESPKQERISQETKEPKTRAEVKQETKPYLLQKLEQESEDSSEGKIKTESEVNQEMNFIETSNQEKQLKEIEGEPKRKSGEIQEIHPTESQKTERISEKTKGVDVKQETKLEPKLAILVSDSKPSKPQSNTSELTSDIRMPNPEQKIQDVNREEIKTQNSSSRKESRIVISTIPRRVPSTGEETNFQKEVKEGLSKLVQKLSTGRQPGGEQGVNIITLAGENKGATMHVGYEAVNREGLAHTNRGFKLKDNGYQEITTNINSNVQGINNSLLNESSYCEVDPGVHLIISSKPKEPVDVIGRMEALKTQKNASSNLQPQKFTYEPQIRRRCLRGLFMESEESDHENPQKQRRHGCRFTCDDKKKAKEEDGGRTSKL